MHPPSEAWHELKEALTTEIRRARDVQHSLRRLDAQSLLYFVSEREVGSATLKRLATKLEAELDARDPSAVDELARLAMELREVDSRNRFFAERALQISRAWGQQAPTGASYTRRGTPTMPPAATVSEEA